MTRPRCSLLRRAGALSAGATLVALALAGCGTSPSPGADGSSLAPEVASAPDGRVALDATADSCVDARDTVGSDAGDAADVTDVTVGADAGPSGLADVYLGGATGVTATLHRQLDVGPTTELSGSAVASAGDVNGDGLSDSVVGTWFAAAGVRDTGVAHVLVGSAGAPPSGPDLQLSGSASGERLGSALRGADFDRDGFADRVVGAPGAAPRGMTQSGATRIHSGRQTGPRASPGRVREGLATGDYSGVATVCGP